MSKIYDFNKKASSKKKKFDFKQKKNNALKSLTEVEGFLNKASKFSKCIKLSRVLKNK